MSLFLVVAFLGTEDSVTGCCQVEEMDNSGHWLPNQDLLWQCGQIFLAEVAIDVAKHAVVGKFNEIRPGVYREFMKVTTVPNHFCQQVVAYPRLPDQRPRHSLQCLQVWCSSPPLSCSSPLHVLTKFTSECVRHTVFDILHLSHVMRQHCASCHCIL